jgi:hypothetical protein
VDGQPKILMHTRIEEFGDLSTFGAIEVIDGTGMTVTPLFDPTLAAGDWISLPKDWSTVKAPGTIGPGQPANLVLLHPSADGRYRVHRVLVNEAKN